MRRRTATMILLRSGIGILVAILATCLTAKVTAQSQMQKTAPPAPSGYRTMYRTLPIKRQPSGADERKNAATATRSLPLWTYETTSVVDGQRYSSVVVGRDPNNHGHRSTSINTLVVPVKMRFAATRVLMDPTVANPCVEGLSLVGAVRISPIFANVRLPSLSGIDVGVTQYVDGYARANFWGAVGGTSYHTLLQYIESPGQTVDVPAAYGDTFWVNGTPCGQIGKIEINWWDNYVQRTLLPSAAAYGAGPDTLVVFLLPSVVMFDRTPGECCILGYHSALASGTAVQTYLTADYDASGSFDLDVGVLSHEVAEWLANPLTTNAAPSWGHIGQVTEGCSPFLEVADPLSGIVVEVLSGRYYFYPQELAFFSWFFRQPPGAVGTYSNNRSLATDAGRVCR